MSWGRAAEVYFRIPPTDGLPVLMALSRCAARKQLFPRENAGVIWRGDMTSCVLTLETGYLISTKPPPAILEIWPCPTFTTFTIALIPITPQRLKEEIYRDVNSRK